MCKLEVVNQLPPPVFDPVYEYPPMLPDKLHDVLYVAVFQDAPSVSSGESPKYPVPLFHVWAIGRISRDMSVPIPLAVDMKLRRYIEWEALPIMLLITSAISASSYNDK